MDTAAIDGATHTTQRQPPEDLLRWHALILQNVRESIIATDMEGAVTYWNQGATALFGYTAEEMLGRPLAVLYPEQGQTRLSDDLTAIESGHDYKGQWLGRRKDGTPLWIDITTTRLFDADGAAIGFIGVARDITELQELEQARDEFLGGIIHDLKTPLTSIRGHAQLAARRLAQVALPVASQLTENLAQIEVGTQRLVRLIDELADVMRLETGAELELDRRPTDVVALVRAIVAQQTGLTGHRLAVETALPEMEVVLDAQRIERVLGNLLSNAIKYSPADSGITVRLVPAQDVRGAGVTITVQDQGIGIPPADLPHIFERFHRARNVVGAVPGTGIGLASAREIVELHGGVIRVESVEGVGTTVSVWLPRTPAEGRGDTAANVCSHESKEARNG